MKRFPVDNMSPGRSWKRIYAPPNDSDSDSSSDSDNSTMEYFRSIYNSYGDYATSRSCTQCAAPFSRCVCPGRASSGTLQSGSSSSIEAASARHSINTNNGSNSAPSPMIILPDTDVEDDNAQPQNNNSGPTSSRGNQAPARRVTFRMRDGAVEPSSSSAASVSFRAATSVERVSSPPPFSSRLTAAIARSREHLAQRPRMDSLNMEGIEPLLSNLIRSEPAAAVTNPLQPTQAQPEEPKNEMDLFHAKLVSMIECPVCLEPIAPPIHQCRRGHLVCAKCKSQVHQCPTCRDKMSDMRNWAVERMAEQLKYPCRNSSSGCPVTALLTERTRHELTCPYRHYTCLFRTCTWTGFQPEMLPHLRSIHPLRFLEGSRQQIDVEMNSPTLFYTDWAISCFGQVFRFNVFQHIPNSMFYASAYLVGGSSEPQAARYTYTVTVNGSLGRRVSFTRQTHSETTRTSQLCHSEDCFSIRGDKMEHFAQPGGQLRLIVELEQLDQ